MNKFFLFFVSLILIQQPSRAQVDFTSSNLPIVILETNGQEIVDEPKVLATMKIINNGPGNRNNLSDTPNDYDGHIGIELRGQSSQMFDKKSYGIELRTATNEDTSATILNMPKEEDWILYAPYSDKSLLRNVLAFHIWSEMGRYGSRTRLCEVVLNGDYKGVYVLMEKIKRDGDRVDIAKLNPDENSGDDLTGGYIIKVDKMNPHEFVKGWNSAYKPPHYTYDEQNIFFQVEYPKPEEISDEQFAYIKSYIDEFESALKSPTFTNSTSGYKQYADVESFADYALFTEINKNVDGYRLSTYLYKDKDSNGGKLKIGPPWDYNLAFGNADYCEGSYTEGWAWNFNQRCDGDYWLAPFWWQRLMQDPVYLHRFKTRWEDLRADKLATSVLHDYIDSVTIVLDEAQQRNFQRWPVLGQYVWPNAYVGATYPSEINYLKSWISDRMTWMDETIGNLEIMLGGKYADKTDLLLYPNPSESYLHVTNQKLISSFEVLDLKGKVLLKGVVDAQTDLTINTVSLASGLYLLRTHDESGVSEGLFIKK